VFERYSEEARLSLFEARYQAVDGGGSAIDPEHLLLGMLRAAPEVFHRMGLDTEAVQLVRLQLSQLLKTGGSVQSGELLPFSERLKLVFKQADKEASNFGHDTIRPEHLLLACLVLAGTSPGTHLVIDAGITVSQVRERLANESPDNRASGERRM